MAIDQFIILWFLESIYHKYMTRNCNKFDMVYFFGVVRHLGIIIIIDIKRCLHEDFCRHNSTIWLPPIFCLLPTVFTPSSTLCGDRFFFCHPGGDSTRGVHFFGMDFFGMPRMNSLWALLERCICHCFWIICYTQQQCVDLFEAQPEWQPSPKGHIAPVGSNDPLWSVSPPCLWSHL